MASLHEGNRPTVTQVPLDWWECEAIKEELHQSKDALASALKDLQTIHTSSGWKLLRAGYRVCHKLLPERSRRRRATRRVVRTVVKVLEKFRKTPSTPPAPAPHPITLGRPPKTVGTLGDGLKLPRPKATDPEYDRWIRRTEPNDADLVMQWRTRFPRRPTVSLAVPTYNTPALFLHSMLKSVLAQTYPHWELCIVDGGSSEPHVAEILRDYATSDPRIKLHFLGRNDGIAGNSNAAIALAGGDFIALLDHDDTLPPFALFEVVKAVNENPDADYFYSDEDKLSQDGTRRFEPHFKSDWAPDTLRSHNYICHLSVFRRALLRELGGFRTGFDGSQDYDLILRATEKAKEIVHIPKVLYHWRTHAASTASDPKAKMYAYESAKRALEHLRRRGTPGTIEFGPTLGAYSVRYELPSRPLVSIIIPNRDQAGLLRQCVESIEKSSYINYEFVILENNSTEPETHAYYEELKRRPNVRVVAWNEPFNYATANNFAARHATGEVFLFLNNDTQVINADWLERMLGHALRPEVGAVGAKLYYPDGTLQHAGVVIGLGSVAGHPYYRLAGEQYGYAGRLITAQNYCAVTAACLMIRREVFEAVGGFDERFVLAFNDVDFCLRVRQKGWLNVWTPDARLYHHESKTRGLDDEGEALARFHREIALFVSVWGDLLKQGDPYYSQHLTLTKPDCSIRDE